MNRRLSRRGVLSGAAATAAVGMTGCLQNPDSNRGGGGGGSDAYVEGDVPGPGSVTVATTLTRIRWLVDPFGAQAPV